MLKSLILLSLLAVYANGLFGRKPFRPFKPWWKSPTTQPWWKSPTTPQPTSQPTAMPTPADCPSCCSELQGSTCTDPIQSERIVTEGAGSNCCCPEEAHTDEECAARVDNNDEFDFIVVGSGPGGGTVACRLALEGYEVLLIEAGPGEINPITRVPAFSQTARLDPTINWDYRVVMTPGRENVLYPRGTGIGGSNAINAMITTYPHREDWQHLVEITGDQNFNETKMREYMRKLEGNQYIPPQFQAVNKDHGYDGYFKTSYPVDARGPPDPKGGQLFFSLFANFQSLGTGTPGPPADIMATGVEDLTGWHIVPGSVKNENSPDQGPLRSRSGVANLIEQTMKETDKLTLLPESFVLKVNFDENLKATGVDVVRGKNLFNGSPLSDVTKDSSKWQQRKFQVKAKNEVIISGGAFNTPQILMHSGIGNRTELEAQNMEVKIDLPGVGKNLQDRLEQVVNYRMEESWGPPDGALSSCYFIPSPIDPCYDAYTKGEPAGDVYGNPGAYLGLQLKSDPALDSPDFHINFLPGDFRGFYSVEEMQALNVSTDFKDITVLILKGHTSSVNGTVSLRSNDPFDMPIVDFAGHDKEDIDKMINITNDMRKFTASMPFTRNEINPGPNVDPDNYDEMFTHVQNSGWGHHACGTAKMSAADDKMGVVDSKFKVFGTEGLRIVDASVFSKIPGFYLTLPILLMAEKAADDIIKEYQPTR